MSFREWEEVSIAETIVSSNTGLDAIKRAPIVEYNSGVKCLRIQDISQSKDFDNWGYCAVENRNYEKFQLKKGDIIVARTGATIGVNKLIKIDQKAVFNNGLIRIRVNEELISSDYLYYNLQSLSYKGHIQGISGGTSTQPNMKMNDLLSFRINLPPVREQKAIAHILSTLDEKIKVNNQINKTLEKMAQAIFKQWFVDFEFPNEDGEPYQSSGGEMVESELGLVPKGWEVNSVGDNAILVSRGIAPKYTDVSEQYVINQKCIRNGFLNYELSRPHKSVVKKEKMLQFGDILINSTGVGTLGRVAQLNENLSNYTVDSHVTIVRPNSVNKNSYLGCLLKGMQSVFEQKGTGSTGQTELGREAIKQISIIVPKDNILEKFTSHYGAINKMIITNQKEQKLLEETRDNLLPKLMSGEMRVPLDLDGEAS